ncbi:MAG: nuclear transport factor 2 family protein [Nitrospirae bacterium]|nr:nuclear transport factor 2 family protein [Nitrospirota bacterium]MBI3595045.1 nuclear transport factor 2 family protein [Nitrospirota bacterium]
MSLSPLEQLMKANEMFYRIFESLDIKEFEKLWSHEEYVQCIHPGWAPCSGWKKVRDSWVMIFNHTRSLHFTISDIKAHILGPVGWVICFENLESRDGERWIKSQVLATNLFELKESQWLMIHHHGSPIFQDNPATSGGHFEDLP